MTNKELVANAVAYLQKTTCYLRGFWCQYDSTAEYQRVLRMYPKNATYHNEKYCNTGVYAADCICFIKQLTAGGTVNRRLSYEQMAAGPLGDCPNSDPVNKTGFYEKLYDLRSPLGAPAGYGLATTGHAALCIGNDQWLDFNYSGSQNGIALHTGFSGTDFKCGKIPGIAYENPEPVQDEVKEFLTFTAQYLYDLWKENKL